MANTFPLKQVEEHFKQVLQYAPAMLGNDAVNFFLDSFKKQGWQGSTFEPWAKRKNTGKKSKGRSILILSGRMRRSIRITGITGLNTTIGTDVPYARAHNEGFNGIVNVRAFKRNRYVKEKLGSGKFTKAGNERMKTVSRLGNAGQVKAHTRSVKITKRQFMGDSPALQKILSDHLQQELIKGLRTL